MCEVLLIILSYFIFGLPLNSCGRRPFCSFENRARTLRMTTSEQSANWHNDHNDCRLEIPGCCPATPSLNPHPSPWLPRVFLVNGGRVGCEQASLQAAKIFSWKLRSTKYVSVAFFVRARLINTNKILTNSAQNRLYGSDVPPFKPQENLENIYWELWESDPLGRQLPRDIKRWVEI